MWSFGLPVRRNGLFAQPQRNSELTLQYLSDLIMRRNNAFRPNMFVQHAIKKQKWMDMTVRRRSQIGTRPASSQIVVVNEKELQNQKRNSPSKTHDAPTAQVLDLPKRILGPRKHEVWSSVVQCLQGDAGKRKRLGGGFVVVDSFSTQDSLVRNQSWI
jgi:hypothetical protein